MNIAFVCSGNTCRSPMAEAIFKDKIKDYREYCSVASFGINAMTGDTAHENAVSVLSQEYNIDISQHRSRIISNYTIDLCDYLICMDKHNYRIIELVAGEKAILLGNGIDDPYGGDIEVYRECAKQIENEIDLLLSSDLFFNTCLMQLDDIPVVAEIEKNNFSEPWSVASFTEELENELSICYVEKYLDKPVGYVCAQIIHPEAFLCTIASDNSLRRRGIGERLVNYLIDYCKFKRCESLSLEVRVSNIPAQKLYEKAGFVNLGIRKNFYSKPAEDAYIMTKYFKEDNQ
ncbi:MAG: ribosomal protein S18-alanine N-acetyltransferase [Clostridia bacterium]|nr:ribosomal protein S18-alanine N-acetyltransferase [Clostridia bacterium]